MPQRKITQDTGMMGTAIYEGGIWIKRWGVIEIGSGMVFRSYNVTQDTGFYSENTSMTHFHTQAASK